MKNPSIKTLRNKTDALLTPLVIKLHPKCLLCPNNTTVAHHFCHKSKSNRLRYEVENLIPLCYSCHLALHWNESFWASKIVQIRGLKWFNRLERMKNEYVKVDRFFYLGAYERLNKLLKSSN